MHSLPLWKNSYAGPEVLAKSVFDADLGAYGLGVLWFRELSAPTNSRTEWSCLGVHIVTCPVLSCFNGPQKQRPGSFLRYMFLFFKCWGSAFGSPHTRY